MAALERARHVLTSQNKNKPTTINPPVWYVSLGAHASPTRVRRVQAERLPCQRVGQKYNTEVEDELQAQVAENAKSHGNRLRRGAALP